MTIYLNARFLAQPLTGVQRYARELTGALDRRLARLPELRAVLGPVIALHPKGCSLPCWEVIESRALAGGTGHFWEQGPLWQASRGALLVSPGGSGPVAHPAQIVTFHDANLWKLPQAFDWRYRLLHRCARPMLARRAVSRLTVSRYSAGVLRQVLGVSDFEIVPNSAEHVLRTPPDFGAIARAGLAPGRYLLTLGTGSPNKNLARLAEAHRLAGPDALPLVAAGGGLDCLRDEPGLRRLGRVSDGGLRALYQHAAGFVFPSLSEGFGIPPLEAMALGTPVLAARSGALPETLGAAPLWFDPLSIPSIAQALRAFTKMNPQKRKAMAREGRRQAAKYSWDHSAARLSDILVGAVARLGADPGFEAPGLKASG